MPLPPAPNPTPGGGDRDRDLGRELRDALEAGNAEQVEAIRRLIDEIATQGHSATFLGQPVRFVGPGYAGPESLAQQVGRQAAEAGFPNVQAHAEWAQRQKADQEEAARARAEEAARQADAARARAQEQYAAAQQSMFDRIDRQRAETAWRQGLDAQAERRDRAGLGEAAQEVAWQKAEAGRPPPAIPVAAQAEYARRAQAARVVSDAARQNAAIQEAGADRAVALATEAADRQAARARAAGPALAFVPRAAGMAAAGFYAAERAAAEGNPVVGGTFEQSANLLRGRFGRDVAPAIQDVSRALQDAADAYEEVPRPVRRFYGRSLILGPGAAALDAAGVGGGRKPELSFEGLPRPQVFGSMWEALQGLPGAGMSMGPLDRRVYQEKMQAALDTIGGNTGAAAQNTAGMSNFFPAFGT